MLAQILKAFPRPSQPPKKLPETRPVRARSRQPEEAHLGLCGRSHSLLGLPPSLLFLFVSKGLKSDDMQTISAKIGLTSGGSELAHLDHLGTSKYRPV